MTEPAKSALLELTRARLLEFVRDPSALFWVFGFPLVLAVALGLAFRERPPALPRIGVVADGAGWAEPILDDTGAFEATTLRAEEAARRLRRGELDVVIVEVGAREVRYRFDPTRPEARAARAFAHDALERGAGRVDLIASVDDVLTQKGARYIDFLIPGLIGINLMGSSMWGIGYALVDARRRKLLKRYAATPMRRSDYLLAQILSRLVFLAFEVAALVAFGWLVFDVEVQGSLAAVGMLSLLGGASFTGLALLIASRTRSTEVASGWLNFAMLPMWLLSGSFFSYARFPEWMHPFIQALPLTALNDALRAVFNEGAGLFSTVPQMAVLLVWGVIPFAVALRVFRWQ